jgi:hypothetical protein
MIDITDLENEKNRKYENWIKHPMSIWGVYPMPKGGEEILWPLSSYA